MSSEIFAKELNWIKSDSIRNAAQYILDQLPDYFYHVAASSTGKYHPEYALGDGGLVRHTKAAVTIAHDLLGLEMYGRYSEREHDLILFALLVHDGLKHGKAGGKYTVFTHPNDIADFLEEHRDAIENDLGDGGLELVQEAVRAHMGQFNTDKRSSVVLEKPTTAIQKFVHQCDYLASRKYLEVAFDKINYDGDRV